MLKRSFAVFVAFSIVLSVAIMPVAVAASPSWSRPTGGDGLTDNADIVAQVMELPPQPAPDEGANGGEQAAPEDQSQPEQPAEAEQPAAEEEKPAAPEQQAEPEQPAAAPQAEPAQPTPQKPTATHQAEPAQPAPEPPRPAPHRNAARLGGSKHVKDAGRRGDVSFNFDDADVYSVVQTVFGDVLGVNYVVDPAVKGRVTFRSVAPILKEDVLPVMEVILRLNGIGVVEEGGLYRIVQLADISREPSAVGMGRDAETVATNGMALVQVVPVRYVQSSELVKVLTPFLSKNAVIVDVPKSNYIILVDTDANVKRLLQLVEIFDSEELKEVTPQVYVYPVQNSKAKDVAALLEQIYQGKQAPVTPPARTPVQPRTPTAPGAKAAEPAHNTPTTISAASAGEALVAESTRIIADETTNSVIILATPADYARIAETIKQIDIMPRQVVIEGLIVRVELKDNLSFGFAWSVGTDVKISNVRPFSNNVNLSGDAQVNSGAFDTTKLPTKGFTFVGSDPSGTVRAVLTALAEESKAKILAAPHILVSDNKEARIQVGSQVPVATSTTSTTAVAGTTPSITSTIQYKDIGIILKVKPQVNDSGLVSLELSQEVSSLGTPVSLSVGTSDITIDKTEATTNMVARDGQTIIIGGLIREDGTKSKDGLPFLSKIPIIGNLFGTTTDNLTRSELIILLTPHVIKSEQQAQDVTSDYIRRYKGVTRDRQIDEFIGERRQVQDATEPGGEKGPANDSK